MLLVACDGVGGVFGLPLPYPGLGLPTDRVPLLLLSTAAHVQVGAVPT